MDFLGINFYYTLYVKNSDRSLQVEHRDYMTDMAVELERMLMNHFLKFWLDKQFHIEFQQLFIDKFLFIIDNQF